MKNEWDEAIAMQGNEQQMAEDESTRQYGEQVLSEFDNLVQKGEQQRAEARRMQDATLSAMMLQAKNGNGFVPREVLDAASKNMGFPVAGGTFDQKGNFILLGMKQNEDGSSQMAPVAIADPEMQFRTLSRAKMGIEYQRELYDGMAKRFTPTQLQKSGIVSPDAVVSSGTTMSGETAKRLGASIIHERRGISGFGSNGKGGFTKYGENGQVDFGTRATGQEQWKQISVGADPNGENGEQIRRYENSKTGEVVSVRDGENPPWQNDNMSERVRIAKMNNDARAGIQRQKGEQALEVAQTSAEATKYKADALKRIAELRGEKKSSGVDATPTAAGRRFNTRDLKDVVAIMTNPMADDETKKSAREIFDSIANSLNETSSDGTTEKAKDYNGSRTPEQIRHNPKVGDKLPLKGGGMARWNGTKWEKVD